MKKKNIIDFLSKNLKEDKEYSTDTIWIDKNHEQYFLFFVRS